MDPCHPATGDTESPPTLLRVAEWLAIPGVAAGCGAAVFWIALLANGAGSEVSEWALPPLLFAAVLAGWGAFLAPLPALLALALVGFVRLTGGRALPYRRTLRLVALGLLGTLLAWALVPRLL